MTRPLFATNSSNGKAAARLDYAVIRVISIGCATVYNATQNVRYAAINSGRVSYRNVNAEKLRIKGIDYEFRDRVQKQNKERGPFFRY